MSDLLKQAIADAKAVRATALSNAKAALEEHFAPKLQSMLSEKLAAEMAEEEGAPEVHADAAQDAAALAASAPVDAAPAPEVAPEAAPEAAPVDAAPAPEAAPAEEPALEETEEEIEEYQTLGSGNPDPVEKSLALEAKKASSNYKAKTKGHKTEDKGQEIVDATKLATKGEPKAVGGSHKASPDYKKTTSGHKTDDPQGQGNELSKGGYDNDTAPLKEGDEDVVDEASLDEILKELESGLNEVGMDELAEAPEAPAAAEGGDDEEIDLNELLSESDDEDEKDEEETVDEGKLPPGLAKYQKEHGKKDDDDDSKEETVKENLSLKKELAEYRSAVEYLRTQINEVNLLNAKLLYTNKLFKAANLNNAQKMKVIESFDLTKSVREAKLVYATLAESFSFGGKKPVEQAKKPASTTVKTITEGLASKPVASTKPTKAAVLTEGAEMANRFKKLAGIRN